LATDPGADTLTYTWAWGDGTDNTAGQNVTHTFADQGTFTVTLTATDDDGAATSATTTVTVTNANPTITPVPDQTGNEGQQLSFSATAADPGADTLTYTWAWGDATPNTTGQNVTHTFVDDKTGANDVYTVTLTVTDEDGGTATDTINVTVNNVAPTPNAGNDQTGNEGASLSFAATATDPANVGATRDTITYSWAWGDGTPNTAGQNAAHTFADNGSYTVTLTASDEDGGSATDTLVVTVNNVAPTVDAGNNQTANEGSVVTFNGSATDPGAARDPLSYCWRFADNLGEICGQDLRQPTYTYTQQGTYTARLRVTDGDNGETIDTVTVVVNNVAPTVNAGNDMAINEGTTAPFLATVTDPGADTLTYTWSWGDGTPAQTGQNLNSVSHTYTQQGTYSATLTVNDGTVSVTDTVQVTVANVAPQGVSAGNPQTGNEGGTFTFIGAATDPGADTLTYRWAWGDGTPDTTGQSVTHTFADDKPGANDVYTVTLSVNDGTATTTATVNVTVTNVAPTLNPGNDRSISEGDSVTFGASATDPGGANDPLTYAWDFGDGSPAESGLNLVAHSHRYTDDKPNTNNDAYTVTVTVTDGDGGTTTRTLSVTVNNVAPSAELGPDLSSNEGALVQFAATVSDPGADPRFYAWDFGDGDTQQGYDLVPSHVYADDGDYLVRLTVTDEDGGSVTDSIRVSVANVAPSVFLDSNSFTIDEGELLSLEATGVDRGADVLTFLWSFGDGQQDEGVDLSGVSHVYDDNGVYTGRVTLTDDEDASDSETFTVRVNNVPPRIVSQPPLFGQEGVQYTYTVSLTDPGDDTFTYTLTERPQGMTVSNAGVVSWTPNAQQALEDSWHVALTVRDDDGGTVSQEWDISLNIQDADGDTLPDACERLCQGGELDVNAPNDANGDADADNLSNAQECSVGANPCFFNGPTAPTPLSPLSGLVEVSPVEFIFTNATDPDSDPLSYKFELAPLEQADQPFVVLTDIVEGQGQTMVSVMESEGLLEDSQYIWRARANDGTVDGPWSEPGSFRFSLLDQPPGRPVGVSPVGVAGALTPALVLNNTTDPEEQAIEYQFQVSLLNPDQGEEPFSRTSPWVAQRNGGTTSWTVDVALQENRSYTWQAKARDVRRNEGPWSVGLVFQVNGDNAAPPTPTLLLPEEGQTVEGEPILVAKTVVDEDGDRVSYVFRLSSAADFNEGAILASSEAISPEFTEGEVSWTPTGVVWAENTAYWWSVQAFDTSNASNEPATRSFRLSANNEAPDKPVLVSPVGDSVISEADPRSRSSPPRRRPRLTAW
jgi:PKD repeat protein